MITCTLDDIEEYKKEFGEQFHVPDQHDRTSLKKGDIVKLIFRFEDDSSEFASVERMWVVITGTCLGKYTGYLNNHPSTVDTTKDGDLVNFDYRHILEIYRESPTA